MAGENTELDFDNMSDEDFLKISEEDAAQAVASQTPPPEESQTEETQVDEVVVEEVEHEEVQENIDDESTVTNTDGGDTDDDINKLDPHSGKAEEVPAEDKSNEKPKVEDEAEKAKSETEEKAEKTTKVELPEGMTAEKVTAAVSFMETVTATFKADGKDFTVRSAEDAVKLIQQGVNYSRRMEQLKPMKALNRMLTDHGLNDTNKLSFLIDIAKGDKVAITKLLKDNNLDPMDLDTSGEVGYQAKSYAGNPQDNAFRDALDVAIAIPEGQALVSEIHKSWDEVSKAKLRDDPSVLGNLVEMKQSGIYSKIVEELEYQKRTGYLVGVPFLQAFDQVGAAMKNAGVFDQQKSQPVPTETVGQLQGNTQQAVPVASGARKVQQSKKPDPNPHLSSAHPSTSVPTTPKEQNFDKLSDEDFLKMPPPT